jgi:hypothetical protein
LIGWHINQGKDSEALWYPISRFRQRYFRPDVVAKELEAGEEQQALRYANAESGRETETRLNQVQDVLPPAVSVLSPSDGDTVSAREVLMRLAVRSPADAPVLGLRVRVNGVAASFHETRSSIPSPYGGSEYEITVPISSSNPEIQVFADNKNATSAPASVRLIWSGTPPPRAELADKPKLFVLAIGVSRYDNPAYRLGFAAKDAIDFGQAMQAQKGSVYSEVEVKTITDGQATRDAVLRGLAWLQSSVTERDVGMALLSGHGLDDRLGKYYYAPANIDLAALDHTGVVFSQIKDALVHIAGRAVFFVDTCHSGNVLGGSRSGW